MAAFLANVGVNAAHAAGSPLFPDGSFRLVPIPGAGAWRPPMLRFRDLDLDSTLAPASWTERGAHLDPDLDTPTPTYGDNCRTAGRVLLAAQGATWRHHRLHRPASYRRAVVRAGRLPGGRRPGQL